MVIYCFMFLTESVLSFLSIPYNAILALGTIFSGVALILPDTKKFSIKAEDLTKQTYGNNILLIDVRTDPQQRIPKSKLLNIENLQKTQQLNKNLKNKEANIVLITENRAQGLANMKLLKLQGYQNVLLLDKGIKGWLSAGLPVISKNTAEISNSNIASNK